MTWTMPRPVLRLVALLIGLSAAGAFLLGALTAPPKGRLPGERAQGQTGAALEATEATPLGAERIEGPPPPRELTPEEQADLDAEKAARAEAEAERRQEAAARAAEAAPTPPPAPPQPDRVGDLLEKAAPPQEEPVF